MQAKLPSCIRRAIAAGAVATIVVAAPGTSPAPSAVRVPDHAAHVAPISEQADWLSQAQRSMSEREYEATDAGAGLQAPNRAHGLRTYFEPDGVRVTDRDDSGELARLRTVGVGRDELRPVSPGEVVADGSRVEVRRPGLVEWYENSERGLEQGWTIAEPPDGDGPLAIEVDFGDATVRVDANIATVVSPNRGRLDYGGLAASDAGGSTLAVRMESVSSSRVRIVVVDADARYPLTVDPMLTQPAFATLMGDQAGAAMGYTIAGAGDVNHDGFDDVIVGAPLYDNGQTDEGAAFVFLGGPNGIAGGGPAAASARLESNQANATFGVSVASAGDVNHDGYADVIVGAEYYDSGQTDEGAAFVFLGSPSGIANGNPTTAATTLQSNQAGATFGYSVASAGDVNDDGFSDVIVGAPDYSSGQTKEGGAFVFLGSPSGIPSGNPATANTVLQSNRTGAGLGISVASAGDTNGDGYDDVIAGARLYVHQNLSEEGGAFVWLGGPAGVTTVADAEIYGDQALAHLGISVASAGDTNGDGFDDVVIGANSYDTTGVDQGLVVVFDGGPSGVTGGSQALADARLTTTVAGANLGISVAGAGDVDGDGYADIFAGAHLSEDPGGTNEGAASLIFGGPSGIPSGDVLVVKSITLRSGQDEARLGVSVAGLGDVNRDGYDDVAAGASFYDSGQSEEGAAFVYLGGPDGLNGYPLESATIQANQAGAALGLSVAGAGDVNGDGYDDVIVGAFRYDLGRVDEGAAFVFLGGPAGIGNGNPLNADAVLHAVQAGAYWGLSVAGAGDVNDDGYDDVVVGAPEYASGMRGEGAAFVYLGGPAGIRNGDPFNADAVLHSDQLDAEFGFSVAGAGDVNDDGYDDVVVGMLLDGNDGAAFVFHGSSTGIPSGGPMSADAALHSNQANAGFGRQVAGAGDTNGDGYDDVIVAAHLYDSGEEDEGAAFVFLGGPAGVGDHSAADANAKLQSDQRLAELGSVAGAGDVNGDGYDDVIVGKAQGGGGAYVFLGGLTGVGDGSPANANTVIRPDGFEGAIGYYVAGVGDVNGDGYDDVATTARIGHDSVGLVYLGGLGGVPNGTPRSAAAALIVRDEETVVTVAGAGDVDGDGFDDVIVGDSGYTNVQPGEGGAFVFNLQRPSVASSGSDTVGIYAASTGAWFLRNANSAGGADVVFTFGAGGSGFVALRGDWDGDGDDTPGLYAPSTGAFFLRNTNAAGGADVVFTFGAGNAGYVPMVGDWNGDGTDTVGLYQPTTGTFFLRNANASGGADLTFGFGPGNAGWRPISGDWNGDGKDSIGMFDPVNSNFFLKNTNGPGAADVVFGFGPPNTGWIPIAGDFDGNRTDTVALYNPSNGFFFLRNSNAPGAADLVFGYGPAGVTPLVGNWDGQ